MAWLKLCAYKQGKACIRFKFVIGDDVVPTMKILRDNWGTVD